MKFYLKFVIRVWIGVARAWKPTATVQGSGKLMANHRQIFAPEEPSMKGVKYRALGSPLGAPFGTPFGPNAMLLNFV